MIDSFFHFEFLMKNGPFCFFFFNHIPLIEALKNVERGSKFQEYTLGHDRYLFFHFEFCGKMGQFFFLTYSPTRGLIDNPFSTLSF